MIFIVSVIVEILKFRRLGQSNFVSERSQPVILLVIHDIGQSLQGRQITDTIYSISVPVIFLPFKVVKSLVALSDCVRGNVRIEMVDMMVFNSISEGIHPQRNLKEGTPFEGCFREFPGFLPMTVRLIYRVLEVK